MMDQYFNARQLVNEKLKRCDLLEELHKQRLQNDALKLPVYEASHAINEKSPLILYECLIPKIALHTRQMGVYCMKCRVKAQESYLQNFPLNIDRLRYQNELYESRVPQLEEENKKLKEIVEKQENDLDTVQWFIKVFEEGLDTKQLAKSYAKLKK